MSHLQLVVTNLRNAIVGPVDLTVAAGACAAVSGPSGAGKSLLLRMIADLEPNEGEVRLGDLRRNSVAAPEWRRQAVYVAAESGWWAEAAIDHFDPTERPQACALAELLGLSQADLSRPMRTLSTGERQRLALARALAVKPKLLLLDEPTGALDPASITRVEALLLRALAAKMIIILVSHDAAQAQRLATTRHVLAAGRLEPA